MSSKPIWAMSDDDVSDDLMKQAESYQKPAAPVEPSIAEQDQEYSAAGAVVRTPVPLSALIPGEAAQVPPQAKEQEYGAAGVVEQVPEIAPEYGAAGVVGQPQTQEQAKAKAAEAAVKAKKRWAALLDPLYWDNAQTNLLRPVEKGGMRSDIGVSGDHIKFVIQGAGLTALISPPSITANLATGQIKSSGALPPGAAAAAFVEIGKAAGYTKMSFTGSPDFIRAATECARAAGIEVMSDVEIRVLQKNKAPAVVTPPAPKAVEPVARPAAEPQRVEPDLGDLDFPDHDSGFSR